MTVTGPRFQPVHLDLQKTRELRIRWADGIETVLPLATLRGACPCATCRALREERLRSPLTVLRTPPNIADMTAVEQAELVGHYALRVRWKDGHDTGIFDFALLRSLSQDAAQGGSECSQPS
jgi:DUF971 family protein